MLSSRHSSYNNDLSFHVKAELNKLKDNKFVGKQLKTL